MHKLIGLVVLGLVFFGQAGGVRPAAPLGAADAVILGLVEGITEFLPISSTGHLIIASSLLGLDSEAPLLDAAGAPLWQRPPSAGVPGVPLTVAHAAKTYTVVIQFGAIAAVALLYRARLASMVRGVFGRDRGGRRLLINLIVAFVPAAAIGFLANDWIDEHLFSVKTVIAAQIAGAVLMLAVERWRSRRPAATLAADPSELSPRAAAGIGLMQCVALWPGTSRSMATIVGGYLAGLDAKGAAEFSFLLGFVTLTAAAGYKSVQGGAGMIAVFGWPHVVLGAVVAAIAAAAAVRFLVQWLTRHGLAIFAWYRLATAAALLLWINYQP